MRAKLPLLILVAGGAAAGAVWLAQSWLADRRAELLALENSQPVEIETIDTVEVLVSREALPSGTFLNLEQFDWVAFPVDAIPESYFTRVKLDEQKGLTGAVLRGAITLGEPLTQGRVIRPGDRGFLAAVLRPEMRAVSVPVDATTGIAGFVFPGDRVDLLLTHEINFGGTAKRLATETILNDLRVLAVDQRTDDTEGQPALAKTATLEVDARQAEVIAVALRMGRLSLALRALAQSPDAPATATPSLEPRTVGQSGSLLGSFTGQGRPATDDRTHTWDSQASRLLPPVTRPAKPQSSPPAVKVTVNRGGATETVEFSGRVR